MVIRELNISKLKQAKYNPRQATEQQEANLKESLSRFGVVEPIIVNMHKDRENVIVGGHFRVRELKKLGYKKVHCVIVYLVLEDEMELNVRLNKNTGDFDYDVLANNFDTGHLIKWGFSEIELGLEPLEVIEKADNSLGITDKFQLRVDFETEEELKLGYNKLKELGFKVLKK